LTPEPVAAPLLAAALVDVVVLVEAGGVLVAGALMDVDDEFELPHAAIARRTAITPHVRARYFNRHLLSLGDCSARRKMLVGSADYKGGSVRGYCCDVVSNVLF
jgi:hypothetical protein